MIPFIVVVDRLSKFSHFIIMKHPFTAKKGAEVFIERVVSKHGIPKSIVTDCDKIFLSSFWKELFAAMGRDFVEKKHGVPSPDQWSNGKSKSMLGILPKVFLQ